MKKLILTLLLLSSFHFASGQFKVRVIDKDEGYPSTVYVLVDNYEVSAYGIQVENFQLGHYDDPVFIEMTREECAQMRSALKKIRRQYRKWDLSAKVHNVRNYAKMFDTTLPPVSLLWTTTEESAWGGKTDVKHRADSVVLSPCFYVKDGNTSAACRYAPDGIGSDKFSIRIFLTPYNLNNLIRNCDTKRIDRLYREKHPKPKSKEYYDSIFR